MPRNRNRMLTGLFLALLCIGVILSVTAIRHPPPIPVTIDDLLKAPNAYIDQFVEVQGSFGMIGLDECSGLGHGLVSLTRPGKYVLVDISRALVGPERVGRASIQGWVRKDNAGLCGAHSPLSIQAVTIDFLESLSP